MAHRDESPLEIIEVDASPPPELVRKPVPPKLERSTVSPEKALKELRSLSGADSVIKRLPALADVERWGPTAYWSVCESSGAAFDPFFWDADFMNNGFSVEFAADNCVVMFWGHEDAFSLHGPVTPPQTSFTGQIWCDMEVANAGYYLFMADVGPNGDPPDYTATAEFCIDSLSLGQRVMSASGTFREYFLLRLGAGLHRFIIKQVSGVIFFWSLTAWNIPVVEQPPVTGV